jgi:hypothetical protein
MKTLLAAALAALLGIGPPALAAPAAEHLVMAPYPGPPAWKSITDKTGPNGFYHEHIPANQTVANFTDILTDQSFNDHAGFDPRIYLRAVFDSVRNACSGLRVAGPQVLPEGGYQAAYGQVYCGRQNGKPYGVMIFYKVISGRSSLYVISREFHTPIAANGAVLSFPPGHEAEAAALLKAQSIADQYLANQVYLCGGASSDSRCR